MTQMRNKLPVLFKTSEAAQLCGGTFVMGVGGDNIISSVAVDSRKVVPGALFVALKGERTDGHRYIADAVGKGAVSILLSREFYESAGKGDYDLDVSLIAADDPLTSLQLLAEKYVERFSDIVLVGITGSSGKTTTKELLKSIFSRGNSIAATKGNLNSEIGLPLSVFQIREEHKYGFFEMGINFKGEMDILSRILKPRHAVVTNIGTAHIGLLGSEEEIALEKGKICSFFKSGSRCFIYENEKYFKDLALSSGNRAIPFGEKSNPSLDNVENLGIDGWRFLYDGVPVTCKLPGRYNLRNIYASVAVAEYFKVPPAEIKEGLENVSILSGRSRIFRSNVTVIEDYYNANAQSMTEALEFFKSLSVKGRKIAVLGSMKELGKESERLHANVGRKAAVFDLDRVLFYGEEMYAAYMAANAEAEGAKYFHCETMGDLKKELKSCVFPGDTILLKGSRSMELEKCMEVLKHV